MQDQAETHAEGTMDTKLSGIRKLLDYSTSHYTEDPRQLVWIYNFMSAYAKKTALGTSSSDGYRMNATSTNKAMIDYLSAPDYVPGPTGIVLMDYVGVNESNGITTHGIEVVNKIIENNFRYLNTDKETDLSGRKIIFQRDEDRDFSNKMNAGAKNGVPFMADFDGNGLMDVLFSGERYTGNWEDGSYIAYANGAGYRSPWSTICSADVAGLPVYYGGLGSRMFDFDQDGKVDIMLPDNLSSGWTGSHPNEGNKTRIRLIKNNGNSSFQEVTQACDWSSLTELNNSWGRTNGECALHSISVADVDMDGYPDILLQNENGNPWERVTKLYINQQGNGYKLSSGGRFIPTNGGSVFLGDLNGDGYPDAVVSGYANANEEYGTNEGNRLDFYRNDGKGNFTLANTEINPDVNHTSQKWGHSGTECVMYMLDFDQDGKLDILIMGGIDNAGVPAVGNSKRSVLLRNVSANGKMAFEETTTGIWPTSSNIQQLSAMADFNGDGFVDYIGFGWGGPNGDNSGYDWVPNDNAYTSYSTGKGQYETIYNVFPLNPDKAFFSFGDADGDGMLDFLSPDNNDNGNPYFYRNRTFVGRNADIQVPGTPTNVKATYDATTRRLTLNWDKMTAASGSKAVYNVYIVKEGKTFMRCPAIKETGKQTTYPSWNNYLPSETCFFENIEPGVYEVGVQSVAYSYNASEFNTMTIAVLDEHKAADITIETEADAVFIQRKMKAGVWNSFCVPFDMEIPEGWEVKALDDRSGIRDNYVMLFFSDATGIEAGKPYMVRVATDIEGFTAENKTVVPSPTDEVRNDLTFRGTFTQGFVPQDAYFISGNMFWQAQDETNSIKGYRAYIMANSTASVNQVKFYIGNDLVTGIGTVENNSTEETESIYSTSGIRLPHLQKGINIVRNKNGQTKKIIIK